MKVHRDFQQIYKTEEDPWGIGDAASDRYNFYYERIVSLTNFKQSILDIGCGFGSFLARFKNDFNELSGVEVSAQAIAKGRAKHPFINFINGAAQNLKASLPSNRYYDAIIFSDVICYLNERGKNASLKWISEHLCPDGLALVATWCPGNRYLEYDELRRLVEKHLVVEEEHELQGGHGLFLTRKRKHYIAVTVNYETWNPIPEGKSVDWEKDIFLPTERLLSLFNKLKLSITLMPDMGEYFWLKSNQPSLAKKMEEQWSKAVSAGNDVQMYLHPNWFPETGARFANGKWHWDPDKSCANNYGGDLITLIAKCKDALESTIRKTTPEHSVTSFRAGGYQTQPFKRLHDALTANGIFCDSSVYAGGISTDRGYDYSLSYSNHQPYFANPFDPQLKALPNENNLIEIPIFTYKIGERWFFDSTEGKIFASRLLIYLTQKFKKIKSTELYRISKSIKNCFGNYYSKLRNFHKSINPFIPKSMARFMTFYEPETLAKHNYFVMIGHAKADLFYQEIEHNLETLKADNRFEFITLSEMANNAREELSKTNRKDVNEEANYQVNRSRNAIMSDQRNEEQSFFLQKMIPPDTDTLLDLGCGSGYWSSRISQLYPWIKITGADWGKEFIEKAINKYASDKVSFHVENFSRLSFSDNGFDCVYADNVLEHSFNLNQTLHEIIRVLKPGGVLVAAFPSDARNTKMVCDSHTWKTAPHEARMRLENAGFIIIEIKEIDTFLELGMPPYPPSNDKMIYIVARKINGEFLPIQRAVNAMNWAYEKLSPEKSSEGIDPIKILAGGHAWCMGYAIVLGCLLKREHFDITWITMVAQNHPRGRGPKKEDTHEVIQLKLANGHKVILDPMANLCFNYSIEELIQNPELSNINRKKDSRYIARNYDLYSTSQWYEKVVKYCVRGQLKEKPRYKNVGRKF